jgi:hypothetical protein
MLSAGEAPEHPAANGHGRMAHPAKTPRSPRQRH